MNLALSHASTSPSSCNAWVTTLLIALSAFSLILLSACASFGPQTVDVPMWQLQESLTRKFPLNSEFARMMNLTLSTPKLRALPDENRIGTEVDLSIAPRFFNNIKLAGKLSVDSALRFEPADQTVRLSKPRIRNLSVDGLKDIKSSEINLAGLSEFILENALQDMVVYQVTPEQAQRFGANIASGDFRVTPNGLSVTLTAQQK